MYIENETQISSKLLSARRRGERPITRFITPLSITKPTILAVENPKTKQQTGSCLAAGVDCEGRQSKSRFHVRFSASYISKWDGPGIDRLRRSPQVPVRLLTKFLYFLRHNDVIKLSTRFDYRNVVSYTSGCWNHQKIQI